MEVFFILSVTKLIEISYFYLCKNNKDEYKKSRFFQYGFSKISKAS